MTASGAVSRLTRARYGGPLLALATVVVFLLGLLGVEAALRLADPGYFYELHAEESSNVYSQEYGWELRRGFRGIDFGEMATVNSRGYRGREHTSAKPAGRTRVLMLGDSIAYGAGVEDDATFSSLLESGGRFDVVNLAVGGYGTDQELLRLEREGLAYRPDLVVLNFCLFSDFTDNALPSALFDARQPKPYFTWDGRALVLHDRHVRLSAVRRSVQWLSDYSHLYNRLRVLLGMRRPPREPGVWADRIATVMTDLPTAAELTFRLIRRMADLSTAAGARFVVLIHPDDFAYHHRSKLLRKFSSTPLLEGITVVELGERYRERGLAFGDIMIDAPGHLNRAGHKVAAEIIARVLSPPLPAGWDYRAAHPAEERDAGR